MTSPVSLLLVLLRPALFLWRPGFSALRVRLLHASLLPTWSIKLAKGDQKAEISPLRTRQGETSRGSSSVRKPRLFLLDFAQSKWRQLALVYIFQRKTSAPVFYLHQPLFLSLSISDRFKGEVECKHVRAEDMTFYGCNSDAKVETQRQMVLNKSSHDAPSPWLSPPFLTLSLYLRCIRNSVLHLRSIFTLATNLVVTSSPFFVTRPRPIRDST